MNMDRFFEYVRRFNSLLPLLAILVAVAGICWSMLKERGNREHAVQTPYAEGQPQLNFSLNQVKYLEKNGIRIFHLDAREMKKWELENGLYQSYNLLLIPDNQQAANWVFKDQAQIIQKFETYPKGDSVYTKAIYIEASPISQKDDASKDNFMIYLAKLNGDKPVMVLNQVDKVIGENLLGNDLQIIYQQGLSLMRAKISIDDFKIHSNQEIAKITGMPSK